MMTSDWLVDVSDDQCTTTTSIVNTRFYKDFYVCSYVDFDMKDCIKCCMIYLFSTVITSENRALFQWKHTLKHILQQMKISW